MIGRIFAAVQGGLAPEESANSRERLFARAGRVLLGAAALQAGLSLLVLFLALLAGLGLWPSAFNAVRLVSLWNAGWPDDAATAAVILLLQLNASLLLVGVVGTLAREAWALVWLVALLLGNGLALVLWGFTPALLVLFAVLRAGWIAWQDRGAFRLNPVMLKEVRGRMRGARAFVVLAVYLGLMSAFLVLLYLVLASQNQLSGSSAAGEIGRVIFAGMVGAQLLLIIFIAPAFTAGAITGERERQTFDLLRTTLLPASSFLLGKLESALSYVFLLLLAAIPLQAIAFLFGGVTETELLLAFVILSVTAVLLGALGIFFSASAGRTLSATLQAYSTALVGLFIAPFIASLIVGTLLLSVRSVSPFLETVFTYLSDLIVSLNPLSTAYYTQEVLVSRQTWGFWRSTLVSDGSQIPRVAPWVTFTLIYLGAAAVLTVLAIRQMRRNDGEG